MRPPGRYDVVEPRRHDGHRAADAERERFDARFSGVSRCLAKAIRMISEADVRHDQRRRRVGRHRHRAALQAYAREEFLHTEQVSADLRRARPRARWRARPASTPSRSARAARSASWAKTLSIEVTGTLNKPDAAAARAARCFREILLVQADFAIVIKQTALASDAGNFDGDRIPIHVQLVMRHTSG